MKKTRCLLLISLLALALPAFSQTWFKVASEPDTVTTAAGVSWRYGTATGTTSAGVVCPCWSKTFTTAIAAQSISDASNGFLLPDPAPGVAKELDILETAVPQTVTVNGAAKVVPALIPPTYPPIAFTPNVAYSFTLSPMTGVVVIQIGSISVPLTCAKGVISANGSTAAFSCVPNPIAAAQ